MGNARAYYNENDPYAAAWLRNLIDGGHIAPGDVDERSIVDVQPEDLEPYTQCHFFGGIAGWSLALRLAGWPDDRPVWTGSCPCQPLSSAGQRKGHVDERHLWPAFHRLIAKRRPPVVFGEQVANADGREWLAGVRADLEALGYACGAAGLPACSVGAPHRRGRLWFVADDAQRSWRNEPSQISASRSEGADRGCGSSRPMADAKRAGLAQRERELGVSCQVGGQSKGQDLAYDDRALGHPKEQRSPSWPDIASTDVGAREPHGSGAWGTSARLAGADGKWRRVEPGIRLLAHGVPARVGRLRAYGNAIVPQVGAAFIGAYLALARPALPAGAGR